LWRNGEQVRIYTSINNAPLGASDYIEFWGRRNDGLPDKTLFRNPDYQINDKYSLESDTAIYYLTVNNTGGNLRYTPMANTAPSSVTPDAYYMNTVDTFYRNQVNRGQALSAGEYVYSSSYDIGEGWTSSNVAPNFSLVWQPANLNVYQQPANLNVYQAGPANSVTLKATAAGNAPYRRNLLIKAYNNELLNEGMPYFEYKKTVLSNLSLATVLPNANNAVITIGNVSDSTQDRLVVGMISLTYPATYNFNNKTVHSFEVPASATGNYLDIANFNNGGVEPVLYDISNGTRYLGEIASTAGRVKFVLPASTQMKKYLLLSAAPANTNTITALSAPKTFQNLSNVAEQGNYIIISHPLLYSAPNYVEQYRAYRASANGGGFNAKIYNIEELTEQFAFGIKGHPASVRDFVRYAKQSFNNPQYVLMIGRGVAYPDAITHRTKLLHIEQNPHCPYKILYPLLDGLHRICCWRQILQLHIL